MEERILESQFTKANSFSFKGRFGIWSNVICGILLVGFTVAAFFIFEFKVDSSEDLLKYIWQALAGLGIVFAAMFIAMIWKFITLKLWKGGKCKLHIGLLIEVYAQLPVSKLGYLTGELFMTLLITIAIILSFFFWGLIIYIVLLFLVVMLLPNILVWFYIIKQPKNSYFMLEQGVLNSYRKENRSAT